MKAIINLDDVPDFQIGTCVQVFFPDSMRKYGKCERLEEQEDTAKPPLGVRPYYVAAWQRIGELTDAIQRQYQSANGDPKLVEKWAEEIGWQCSMLESLADEPDASVLDMREI